MASLVPAPRMQFFDEAGKPLIGGKLYTYAAGTTTPLSTYKDAKKVAVNTNPIILDARGQASVWLDFIAYKWILYDSNGVLQYSEDDIVPYVADRSYLMSGTSLNANDGTILTCNLNMNTAFVDNLAEGQSLVLMLTGADAYTVSWPAMVWVSGTGNVEPTYSPSVVIVLWKTQDVLYGMYTGKY